MTIKKNKALGVYQVGKYKIGDMVCFKDDEGSKDDLQISAFSDDGKEVFGYFRSDDCGGGIKFADIVGVST